jgi:hypothetical protein
MTRRPKLTATGALATAVDPKQAQAGSIGRLTLILLM